MTTRDQIKYLHQKEIDKAKKELDNLLTFNSIADNKNLSNINPTVIAQQSKLAGVTGEVSFSDDQNNYLKSVSSLRNARKEQLKSLENYNKAMAASGNKERAEKMASVSKKFSDRFARGITNGGGSSFGSGSLASSGSSGTSAKKDDSADKGSSASSNYNSGGFVSGTGSLYGSGSGSNNSKSSATTSDAGSSGSGSGGMSEADQNKLADAIEARNRGNKDKYQSNDEQTLFEKVTNAYIRNYDRVLSKKKDKDVIEQKQ